MKNLAKKIFKIMTGAEVTIMSSDFYADGRFIVPSPEEYKERFE